MRRIDIFRSYEEKIHNIYIELTHLEIGGVPRESLSYQNTLKLLYDALNIEKRFLEKLRHVDIVTMRKELLQRCQTRKQIFAFGHMSNAVDYRILALLNIVMGDDLFDYASILRYDMNQILLAFLDSLINNEYYSEIRESLIYYKFNLLFLNSDSEGDFLNSCNVFPISLKANEYRTSGMPSTVFVDKSMLVLEGMDYLDELQMTQEGFSENESKYALVVISAMELLVRLILCDQNLLPYLNDRFQALFQDDDVPYELKKLMQDLYTILEQLKSNIKWAR